ncbi:DNA polymerase III subunit delta [Paludicola sp. MB14-C6]|uniref:DNA polymerase III subunit delta n=1 Tax=Paludihabitans sp. MB14-C6 TaxID=3070656 RepID=UPI0027DD6E26|nr:DNA polymerase III subunit delta [Paludicola sp. MB14-C6]WMJ21983.1 DNA polymerase III subunit delta [Paludicola sp. MB14-C6]
MPKLNETELKQRIAQGQLANIFFLYGQEDFFVSKYAKEIIDKVVAKQFESFNLNWFHGDKLSLDELEDAIESLPMMADRKCVVVQNLDIDGLSKSDYEKLNELLKSPNEMTVVVFFANKIQYDVKKSSRVKTFLNFVQKDGIVCEFTIKDKSTLKRELCSRAKKESVELDMPIAEYFIDRCSMNYGILIKELDKLIHYVKGMNQGFEITKKAIDLCCIPTIESNAFKLSNAIVQKNYEKAFLLLDELFYQRQEPLAILGALDMCFYDLYRAKVAIESGKTAEEVQSDFGYSPTRSFAIRNAFRDARASSTVQIRRYINILAETDYKLKSSKADQQLLLEQMIAKMI